MLLETDTHWIFGRLPAGARARRWMKVAAGIAVLAAIIVALDEPIWWLSVVGLVAAFALGLRILERQTVRIDKQSRSVTLRERTLSSRQLLCILATKDDVADRRRLWKLELIECSTEPLLERAVAAALHGSSATSTGDETEGLAHALEQFLFDGKRGRTLLVSDSDEAVVTKLGRRVSDVLRVPFVDACAIPPRQYQPGESLLSPSRVRAPGAPRPEQTELAETQENGFTLAWTQSRHADQALFFLSLVVVPCLALAWGNKYFLLSTLLGGSGMLANPATRDPFRGHGRNELALGGSTLRIRLALRPERSLPIAEIVMFRVNHTLWGTPGLSIVSKYGVVYLPARLEVAAWLHQELEQRWALLADSASAAASKP